MITQPAHFCKDTEGSRRSCRNTLAGRAEVYLASYAPSLAPTQLVYFHMKRTHFTIED